jgi:SNF2 family DNA or RNA helicase
VPSRMTEEEVSEIAIEYDPVRVNARFYRSRVTSPSPVWERLRAYFLGKSDARFSDNSIEVPWTDALGAIREFGSKSMQRALSFRFRPSGEAATRIEAFVRDVRQARSQRDSLTLQLAPSDIEQKLISVGFSQRKLKAFQLRDLAHLLSLPHGANFSVPGSGKTTVTFALHVLATTEGEHLLVVCPKSAFPAWRAIVDECMEAGSLGADAFVVLDGSERQTDQQLRGGTRRFVISYDLFVRQQSTLAAYLARQPVHLVLDESHRMKAGMGSQRGAALLRVSSLPVRRDILSGTPMPQDADDLASQLAFLWPGQGLDLSLHQGMAPREVLGQLYVRTTKK